MPSNADRTPSAATEQRPWCECDPDYEGHCPYPCQIDADEKREAASAATAAMKRCPSCGFLPLPDATHCPKCGKPIESGATALLSTGYPSNGGWDEWLTLFASRNEVADEYARMLLMHGVKWGGYRFVNEAILRRWSPAGLRYIKERAWKIANGHL